ncbi:MAG: hypothetical protein CMJ44_14750, partial [Pimelobacter sp.]|nr:hypothetical protein [Pimelobacter sp.]
QLIGDKVAAIQQIRDLLECTWPAALESAAQPLKSQTWLAALTVVMCRDAGDLTRTRRLGARRFETAVRKEILKRGWAKPRLRIVAAMFTALADTAGVIEHRPGGFERIEWLIDDFDTAVAKLGVVEARMVATLDELQLTDLVCSIEGLSAVGAAAILAQTGDLTRFASARAVVKHAGLAPRERMSGTFTGRARLGGAGRPGLRVAAWRAVWGALHNNSVYAERYRHLTTREDNRLKPTQAQTVIAAAILRQLHAVVVTRTAWDPEVARNGLYGTGPADTAITAA